MIKLAQSLSFIHSSIVTNIVSKIVLQGYQLKSMASVSKNTNIDEPRYDQSTYFGRAKHFFSVTNPLSLFTSTAELDKAKDIVTRYRFVLNFILIGY